MNKTDSPLKRLVQMAPLDFAEWILGTEVKSVTTANIELQPNPNPAYTDLVFWVTIDGGKTRLLLHIASPRLCSRVCRQRTGDAYS